MPGKERSNISLILMLLVIAAGQAMNVAALNNTPVTATTKILNITSINITDFSIIVDGSVVDFF